MIKKSALTPQQHQHGFTIIELLVIVVFIGLLTALILSTYTGIRQKERNSERQNDITILQGKLELYYAKYTRYPTLSEVNDTAWRTTYLANVSQEILRDPSSPNYSLVENPSPHEYAYTVTGSDGSQCDNVKKICAEYTLTATLEGGGIFTKSSLN